MSIVNFRIKDQDREYFFLGDHILAHDTWLPIELDDLSDLVIDNVIKAMDAEWIEADISADQVRNLLSSQTKGITIVADIPERDGLTPIADDIVLVQDVGDGTWAKYQWDGAKWVLTEAEGANVIPDLVTLGDVNMAPTAGEDDYAVKYQHSTGKFILAEDQTGGSTLTAAQIKTAYESNANTNEFSDAEELKLAGIEPNASADQHASEVPSDPVGGIVSTNVQSALAELDTDKADANHTHSEYALTGHSHVGTYALEAHDHDSRYSLLGHTHSEYSLTTHNHDLDYAAIGHNHDSEYATAIHNHDLLYSPLSHNHDADYSAINHNHDGRYEQLFGNPTSDGQILTRDINGTTYWSTPADFSAAEINDGVTSLVYTWSSNKMVATFAPITHNHDADYASITHTHDDRYFTEAEADARYQLAGSYALDNHNHDSLYAAIAHNHDTAYASITHNHDLDYAALNHNHDADYSPIAHNHNGLLPAGGTTGQIAVKNTDTDYDYSWADAPSGGGNSSGFVIELASGATVADRLAGATNIPAGWTVLAADLAGVANFGTSADTLVITHNLGQMVANIDLWELETSGPPVVQGYTKINISTQGQQKNSVDRNSCSVIGMQPLTNSARPLYIYVQLA